MILIAMYLSYLRALPIDQPALTNGTITPINKTICLYGFELVNGTCREIF